MKWNGILMEAKKQNFIPRSLLKNSRSVFVRVEWSVLNVIKLFLGNLENLDYPIRWNYKNKLIVKLRISFRMLCILIGKYFVWQFSVGSCLRNNYLVSSFLTLAKSGFMTFTPGVRGRVRKTESVRLSLLWDCSHGNLDWPNL